MRKGGQSSVIGIGQKNRYRGWNEALCDWMVPLSNGLNELSVHDIAVLKYAGLLLKMVEQSCFFVVFLDENNPAEVMVSPRKLSLNVRFCCWVLQGVVGLCSLGSVCLRACGELYTSFMNSAKQRHASSLCVWQATNLYSCCLVSVSSTIATKLDFSPFGPWPGQYNLLGESIEPDSL